jgi:hypothetical protein
LEQAGFGSRDERTLLAQRLYVAMVEQRNLEAQRYGEFQTAPIEPREATALLNEVAAVAASQLRGLVAWWRQCGGDESFKQGLNWCAAQLDLALDGKLPSPISQSEREIDDDNLL